MTRSLVKVKRSSRAIAKIKSLLQMVSKGTPLVHLFISRLPPFFVYSFEFIYLFIHQFCSLFTSLIYFIYFFICVLSIQSATPLLFRTVPRFSFFFPSLVFLSHPWLSKKTASRIYLSWFHIFFAMNSGLIWPFLELMFFPGIQCHTQNVVGLNRAFLER